MRRLSWLLLLLAPLTAQTPPDYPGPRVDLTGELPLAAALAEIAPRLNRRFEGRQLQSEEAAKPYSFDLHDLSEAETIAALEELTGQEFRRTNRTVYSLDRPKRGTSALPRSLGRWRVELLWLRWYFYADLFPGDPSRNRQIATLTPLLEIRAPDDGAALGLVGVTLPAAVTDTGETLDEGKKVAVPVEPDRRQSNLWQLSTNLGLPAPEATALETLELALHFAAELDQARFTFANLADPARRREKPGSYTATLAERGANEQIGALELTLAGPVPRGVPADQAAKILQRDSFLEARLSAGDAPLPTEVRLQKSEVKDGVWTSRWSITAAKEPWVAVGEATVGFRFQPPPAAPPDRLEVTLNLPSAPGPVVPVTFTDLRLPEREQPLP